MNRKHFLVAAVGSLFFSGPVFGQTNIEQSDSTVVLENKKLSLCFNLHNGTYSVSDKQMNLKVFQNAHFVVENWTPSHSNFQKQIYQAEVKKGNAGADGKSIIISVRNEGKIRPEYKMEIALGDNDTYFTYRLGMLNTLSHDTRFMSAQPFYQAQLFPHKIISEVQTLNGAAGRANAEVLKDVSRKSTNSMLLTCLVNGNRYSLVWGGLAYKEFYANTEYDDVRKAISLEMTDPSGKLVGRNEMYWTTDTYYLGLAEQNPFLALEDYAMKLREENHASPNLFDYPTLCGWAVGALSHDSNINNSAKLLEELDAANKCGLTAYTDVAIRLEPDYYCYRDGNTEQGWWDDEHWSRYNHLVKPYDTFAKWCQAIRVNKGIPFTYFQCSMPSDDFAEAHPEWMLHEDISKLHLYHPHHMPNVRYDYTDKGFQNHVLKVWSNLKEAGMGGIKFDYPETAWNPEGGFEDKTATTTSAYCTLFELARKGLGDEARLTERNLGECGRPTLDVTAGIVDMQRITGDNNKYQVKYITSAGLRWYKSRSVFNYYQDCKDLLPLTVKERKSLLTMISLTSGMFELATSFRKFTPEMVHDVSRIYPMYNGIRSPRPLDAFTGIKDPQIYDLELTEGWHQLALFNTSGKQEELQVSLGEEMIYGGLNLNPQKKYYVYDFWNEKFVGLLAGNEVIKASLEPLETNLYSIREMKKEPQIIHTNRHIFQGWMDLKEVKWLKKSKVLTGKAAVIKGESFRMVVALNSMKKIKSVTAENASIRIENHPESESCKVLVIDSDSSTDIAWKVTFK